VTILTAAYASEVDEADRAVRNRTYALFVEHGRAPTADEVGPGTLEAWHRLHGQHALVLDGDGALRMLTPFSVIRTAHVVEARGRSWYANCAWDAIGICGALHADGRIDTTCPDCAAELTFEIRDERPTYESLLFHCLVPAAHWWDDIVFT
jgi:alkylmercury lyase-like protein